MEQLYYPFAWLGNTLRDMSLSGSTGNIVAIIIYCLLSLSPCFFYLWLKRKKKNRKADMLLPVLSIVLFVTLYYLVNPSLFMEDAYMDMPEMSGLMLTSLFYSMLVGYLIFRGIEYCMSPGVKNLQKGIKTALCTMIIVIILTVINECFILLPEAIQTLKEGNTSSGLWNEFFDTAPNLGMSIGFLVLQSMVKVIPYFFDIALIWMLKKMIHELEIDRYSEKVTSGFEKLSKACVIMLVSTVVLNMMMSFLQVIFRKQIYQIHMEVSVPILSIAFVLAVLLISRYVNETKKMKEELDMFI